MRSDQRRPPRATRPPRRCTPSTRGEYTQISNIGLGSGRSGTLAGSSLKLSQPSMAPVGTEPVGVGPQRRLDEVQEPAQDAVLVEAGHGVEVVAELVGQVEHLDGRAIGQRGVEPHREQLHQLAGDGRVGGQGVLDVALAEGRAGLALVLGVGPQHRDLATGQARQQDEAVEAVALDLAPPQAGEGGPQLVTAPRRSRARRRPGPAGRSRRANGGCRRRAAARTGRSSVTCMPRCSSKGSTADSDTAWPSV